MPPNLQRENSMNSFELDLLDEKSRAGSEFMARVVNEIRRALASEKACRKITQQSIAEKIGTSRAVINRQIQGFENLSARRIGELLWAIGWEPYFEARKIPVGDNQYVRSENMIPLGLPTSQKIQTTQGEGAISIKTISNAA
jgi:hypothetical protein